MKTNYESFYTSLIRKVTQQKRKRKLFPIVYIDKLGDLNLQTEDCSFEELQVNNLFEVKLANYREGKKKKGRLVGFVIRLNRNLVRGRLSVKKIAEIMEIDFGEYRADAEKIFKTRRFVNIQ